MNKGRIAQVGTPQDIYERPADPFVADFIGTTNFLTGRVAEASGPEGGLTVALGDGQLVKVQPERRAPAGAPVTLAYRPEQLRIVGDGADEGGSVVVAQVVSRSYVGGRWQNMLRIGGEPVRIETEQALPDGRLRVSLPVAGAILFQGRADADIL
jgi:iron(III) transport system ATP-binding protein